MNNQLGTDSRREAKHNAYQEKRGCHDGLVCKVRHLVHRLDYLFSMILKERHIYFILIFKTISKLLRILIIVFLSGMCCFTLWHSMFPSLVAPVSSSHCRREGAAGASGGRVSDIHAA